MESLKFENLSDKYFVKKRCKATAIHQRLVSVYGDSAPNYCRVTRRFNEFTRGHQSLEDDFRSGRPSDAVNPISIVTAEKTDYDKSKSQSVRDCKRVTRFSWEY